MTSFRRTKVKKTSKSDQVYRIRESLFSKGLQGYTRVSLAIKKIPDIEVTEGVKCRKQGISMVLILYGATISATNIQVLIRFST